MRFLNGRFHLFGACLLLLAAVLLGCGGTGGTGATPSGSSSSGGSSSGSGANSGGGAIPGALFGRVTDSLGTPIAKATFSLSTRGTVLATTASDSFGNYFFNTVPSGVTLGLLARPPGGGLAARSVDIFVNEGESQQLNLVLASVTPTIVSSSPSPLTSNVPITIQPQVVFNVPLERASITGGVNGSVQLNRTRPSPVLAVEGTIDTTFDTAQRSILFTPRFPLAEGSAYEFRLGNAIRDQFGTAFKGAVIPFSTQGLPRGPIVSGPSVIGSIPPDRGTTVSPDTAITFTFDRPVDVATVNTNTITFLRVNPGPTTQDVNGQLRTFGSIRNTFQFVPGTQLGLGNTFTLAVTDGVRDTEGNRAVPHNITFVVRPFGPIVLSSNPVNRQIGVPTTQNFVQLTYDETVRFESAISPANYLLTFQQRGGGIVSQPITSIVSLTSPPNTVRLSIGTPLQANSGFTLTYNNIQDRDGNLSTPGQTITFFTTNLGDNLPPRVISSTPANAQRDVSLDTLIQVTWSEAMASGVLNVSSYDFIDERGPIGIARVDPVTGVANTFRLTPRILPLQPLNRHTLLFHPDALTDGVGNLTVTTGISFTTAAGNANLLDRLASEPRDGEQAFQPSITAGVIRPHFTRRMVQTTIEDIGNYTLTESPATRLPISFAQVVVSSGNTVVTLQPSRALRANTDYTLAFSINLKAADGTNMPANTTLLFKTGAFGDVTPPFILSTFPRNRSTGASVSPAIQIQYSEAMGASATAPANYFISSDLEPAFSPQTAVNLVSPPNSVQLTLPRPLRSLTAYTFTATQLILDSAGNALVTTSIVFTTGTTTGGSLEPPRVSTSNPASGSTGVSTGTAIILSFSQDMNEGSLGFASSVFNSANYTLASTETGTIPAIVEQSTIALNTIRIRPAQSLRGNTALSFLASNNIVNRVGVPLTPFAMVFTTVNIGDSTPPRLSDSIPRNGQVNVNPGEPITLFFSEEMNISGSGGSALNSANYVLFTSGGRSVPLNSLVEAGPGLPNTSFRLRPSVALGAQTTHTLTISSNLRDVAGNRLFPPFSIAFTTGQTGTSGDVTPPFVVATTPSNGAQSIATSSQIVVTFSEAMRTSTAGSALDPTNYVLFNGSGPIPIVNIVPADSPANSFVLRPAFLTSGTAHTVLFTSSLQDIAGNALRPQQISFATAATADVTPPRILSSNPTNGSSTPIPVDSTLFVTFTEPMDLASVTSVANYELTTTGPDGSTIAGSWPVLSVSPVAGQQNTFEIVPQTPMLGLTRYVLSLTNRIKDANGISMLSDNLVYTTRASPGTPGSDVTPPVVVATIPANNAVNVGVNTLIAVTFSEAMKNDVSGSPSFGNSALNPANYIVRTSQNSSAVSGIKIVQVASPPNTFIINAGTLDLNALYVIQLSDRIQDLAGNGLPFTQFFFFTGVADQTAPTVVGAGRTNASIFIQYSERMENTSVLNALHYRIVANCAVAGSIPTVLQVSGSPGTPLANGTQKDITGVDLTLSGNFPSPGTYTLFFSPLITDLAGGSIATPSLTITQGTGCQ